MKLDQFDHDGYPQRDIFSWYPQLISPDDIPGRYRVIIKKLFLKSEEKLQ